MKKPAFLDHLPWDIIAFPHLYRRDLEGKSFHATGRKYEKIIRFSFFEWKYGHNEDNGENHQLATSTGKPFWGFGNP